MLEIKGYDRLREIIRRDYPVFSGLILERYFRALLIESGKWTRIGSWWDRKGENEIDILSENELTGNVAVYEVKRDPKRIDLETLKDKFTVFTAATGKWKRIKLTFIGLSLVDM